MAVVSRSVSPFITNGILHGVLSEVLPAGWSRMQYRQSDNVLGSTSRVYGAGEKVLQLVNASKGTLVPVVARRQDLKGEGTSALTLLSSSFYPSVAYDPKRNSIYIYFWVNGWSPPASANYPFTSEHLFAELIPPQGTEDPGYRRSDTVVEDQNYLPHKWVERDLPPWDILEDNAPGLGPFDLQRFWVAPITDGHLYRVGEDYKAQLGSIVDPNEQTVTPEVSAGIDSLFPFASIPDYPVFRVYRTAIAAQQAGQALTKIQLATVEAYDKTPERLINLARATRVLMVAEGQIVRCSRYALMDQTVSAGANIDETNDPGTVEDTLICGTPKPLWAFPQTTNKVMCHRHKYTSYLSDGRVFINAPLNYRYPGAGTSSLSCGEPVVDFMFHDPSQQLEAWNLGGILPEATTGQVSPWLPEQELIFPVGFPTSIVGFLSDTGAWSSF